MRSAIWAAVVAAATLGGVAATPSNAQASWLSQALHATFDPGYYAGPTYYYPGYGTYYGPGYGGYYVEPGYVPYYGSYVTPYYVPYRSHSWYGPRYYRPWYGHGPRYGHHGGWHGGHHGHRR
jgi:hypothetical protein